MSTQARRGVIYIPNTLYPCSYVQKIVRHLEGRGVNGRQDEDEDEGGLLLSGLEDASDPSAFESVAELMEDLLDNVEAYLSSSSNNKDKTGSGGASAVEGAGGQQGGQVCTFKLLQLSCHLHFIPPSDIPEPTHTPCVIDGRPTS